MGRKLLLHEKVEVRQLEEGLKGSWHPGVVVGVSDSCRRVKYDELLCETGSSKLIESIPVTESIEGFYQRPCVKSNYRGRIRPSPLSQSCTMNSRLCFGVCVDVMYKEAWWEGVIFDYDEDAKERCVFFPDEGDERRYKLTDLRVTLEWDEFSGSWRERGVWLLVNLAKEFKKDGLLFQFIKRVWSRLKVHYGFSKMISEWTCGAYCLWKEYVSEVVCDITTKLRPTVHGFSTTSKIQTVKKRGRKPKRSRGSYLIASVLTRSMQRRKEKEPNLAVRTRRMCLAEPVSPVVSASSQSSTLADSQCKQDQLVAAATCINTRVHNAGEDVKHNQAPSTYCGQCSGVAVKEGCHQRRTAQNECVPSTSHGLEHNSKMSQNGYLRRKWWLKKSSRKLKPSRICELKVERHTGICTRITRRVGDGRALQVQGYGSVDRREQLMLKKQNDGGLTMRFPILRQRRRITISARRTRKKRSPLRIKRLVRRKAEKSNAKSKRTFQEEVEASEPLQNENDLLDSHNEAAPTGSASCPEHGPEDALNSSQKQRGKRSSRDTVCLVCQYGDELLHCDHCMCSYHLKCIDLKEVPVGESFCPSCRCGLCGLSYSAKDDQLFTQVCYQCSCQYHVDCLDKAGVSVSEDSFADKFCSRSCYEICARLHELLQISSPTTTEGLTWTITRSRRNDCNVHNERVHPVVQVSQVLNVFRECFEPIHEPHTGRDLVADIVYNSGSKLRRLDFHGFYVMALVNGEELVCVATIRIFGQKVAEMPLIATPFKHRRKGMCRLLVDELEKMLIEMGVERLVLPAIAQLSETWVSSFGFTEMSASIREELLGYPFVLFQGTTMFQKILSRSVLADTSEALEKVEESVARHPQENQAHDEAERKFNLRYKRRRKPEAPDKGKKAMDGSDKNQLTMKFVYKRRRIQASRDVLKDL